MRRPLHNHFITSTVWDTFPIRADDIIIATYKKSGPTWMQQIESRLILEKTVGLERPV